jgi:hypothetical protein
VFALRLTRNRAQSLIPVAAAVALSTSMLAGAGIAQAGSVPKKCPTAASIQSAAGISLKRTQSQSAAGALLCSYQAGKYGNVVITVGPIGKIPASEFVTIVQAEAKKAHLTKISGIGSYAWVFTQSDAKSNPDGIATTGVFALVGSSEFDVLGTRPAKNIVAVAKALVG